MNKTPMKICQVCGKEFPACSYCEKIGEGYSWRTVVCCREHFYFHMPIIQYIRNEISKEEARALLITAEERYGKVTYLPQIQTVVDKIFTEDIPKKKSMRKKTSVNKE